MMSKSTMFLVFSSQTMLIKDWVLCAELFSDIEMTFWSFPWTLKTIFLWYCRWTLWSLNKYDSYTTIITVIIVLYKSHLFKTHQVHLQYHKKIVVSVQGKLQNIILMSEINSAHKNQSVTNRFLLEKIRKILNFNIIFHNFCFLFFSIFR